MEKAKTHKNRTTTQKQKTKIVTNSRIHNFFICQRLLTRNLSVYVQFGNGIPRASLLLSIRCPQGQAVAKKLHDDSGVSCQTIPRQLPDSFQTASRQLPDRFQTAPRQLPDRSQTAPDSSQTAPRRLPDGSQIVPR